MSKQNEEAAKKVAVGETRTPQEILDELRRLHDEFGDQISEFEEDPKTASSALESIYAEMEIQLDALDDALSGE